MQIKEFYIRRYGPVSERHITLGPGFNLLFGSNEDGKTLTVDALVKLLLGREFREKEFEQIGRVKENPAGYAVIAKGADREQKIPDEGTIKELSGLSSAECRNIFIIRDSNLSIARESDFYAGVTNRLTGLRSEEIASVIAKLRETARLTPTGAVRNVGEEKLRSRLEGAKNLAETSAELLKELAAEGFDEMEREQVTGTEALSAMEARLESLEKARQREKFEVCSNALAKLQQSAKDLLALQPFNEADERRWETAERDAQRLEAEAASLRAAIVEKEKSRENLSLKIAEAKRELSLAEERRRLIDDELRPALKSFDGRKEEVAARESKGKLYTAGAFASTALLALTLLGAIFQPHPLFFVAAISFTIPASFAWFSLYRLAGEKAALNRELVRMKNLLANYGIKGSELTEIRARVQAVVAEYDGREKEHQHLCNEEKILSREIASLREDSLPRCARELAAANETIAELQRISGQSSLRDYSFRLMRRLETEKTLGQQESILESFLGSPAGGDGKNWSTATWERAVRELAKYKGKAAGLVYDEDSVAALKKAKSERQEKMGEIADQMARFSKKLREVEREANFLLQCSSRDYLYCQSPSDLEGIREKLLEFISRYEETMSSTLRSIDLLNEIASEEKTRVAGLFGAGSPITPTYKEITDSLYEEVFFDSEKEEIFVKRRDGAILNAEKLSGGAYDQLYLAIRLTLGEKLLKGGKGFFIMDDPFIKSDPARLKRQLRALLDITERGWQILYFSAKGEVLDALQPYVKSGHVSFQQIQTLFP